MTHEQKLNRLERIARLLSEPGLRARRESHIQIEKLKSMVEEQRKNDERFANLEKAQERPEH